MILVVTGYVLECVLPFISQLGFFFHKLDVIKFVVLNSIRSANIDFRRI
jgi:hypothetical protein